MRFQNCIYFCLGLSVLLDECFAQVLLIVKSSKLNRMFLLYFDCIFFQNPPPIGAFRVFPKTSFQCGGRAAGYYADIESGCQVRQILKLKI